MIAGGIGAAGAVVAALGWIGWRTRRLGALPGGAPLPGVGVRTSSRPARGTRATMRSDRPRRLALAASSERSGGDAAPPGPARERRPRRTGGRPPLQEPGARSAAPPDPALNWRAEIEWRHGPDGSRFCITASTAGSSERIAVGESEPLVWPPTGSDSVQALARAVDGLESGAVAAGWRPASAGRTWYAKRFTWQPVQAPTRAATAPRARAPAATAPAASAPVSSSPAPTAQPLGTGRFKRVPDWPEGTEDGYRCEIMWEAGDLASHFRAMVFRPGRSGGRATRSSKPFKWLRASEPDADSVDFRAEVERLADAMSAAGWQPAGRGAEWFSHRFVWRRKGPPTERVETV